MKGLKHRMARIEAALGMDDLPPVAIIRMGENNISCRGRQFASMAEAEAFANTLPLAPGDEILLIDIQRVDGRRNPSTETEELQS